MELTLLSLDTNLIHIRVAGEVSMTLSKDTDDPLIRVAGPGVYENHVLFNLQAVRFIDSSGLSWLVLLKKRFVGSGGKMVLHSIPPLIRKPIELLRLDRVLPIVPTAADAAMVFAAVG